jgi:isoleucyl-tRNA synthetase
VLHRLHELDRLIRRSTEAYDFHAIITALHNFCAVDLSAFYFDVRKDSLYCDPLAAPRRRTARTVLDRVFDSLARWLAPMLCFTAEEAWICRHGDAAETSVHLVTYAELPASWGNDALGGKWAEIRELRRVVTGALELERAQKRIGSSLQAAVTVYAQPRHVALLEGLDLAEICITSSATLTTAPAPADTFTLPDIAGIAVSVAAAPGEKCQRCWRILPEVGSLSAHPDLCERCADAVDRLGVAVAD